MVFSSNSWHCELRAISDMCCSELQKKMIRHSMRYAAVNILGIMITVVVAGAGCVLIRAQSKHSQPR